MNSPPRPNRRRTCDYMQDDLRAISSALKDRPHGSIWTFLYGEAPKDYAAFRAEEAELARNPQKRVKLESDNRRRVIDFIKARLGRGPGNPNSIPNTEIRKPAKKVDAAMKHWRRENGKQRVPPAVTAGFIDNVIPAHIPRDSGLYANWERRIRNALKAKRF